MPVNTPQNGRQGVSMTLFPFRLGPALTISLICAAGLTGCVDPSAKIATALTRYGLDSAQAQCVGERLENNLTISQLQQLGQAAKAVDKDDVSPGRLTATDFIRVASEFQDVRVPLEVAQAAAGCGVLANPSAAKAPAK